MTLQVDHPKQSPAARLAADRKAGQAGRKQGLGAQTQITVKGVSANSAQLAVINGVLTEANDLGAAQRVMVACIMAITQESTAMALTYGDAAGPDSRGPFQQRASWGPLATRMSPSGSCRLFLQGAPGCPGWAQNNGSVKNAPGNLGLAIQQVQGSSDPTGNTYNQWQPEATRTVASFLGGNLTSAGLRGEKTVTTPYEFTRGQAGQPETSWTCSGRLASDVGWSRWAQANTLFFVSDEELRAAAPSLRIDGTEDFLRNPPAYEWSPKRAVNQVTLDVWAKRWGVQIGAVVEIAIGTAVDGLYLVTETHGNWVSPELQVVLERPAPKRLEPASTTRTVSTLNGFVTSAGSATASKLLQACEKIDRQPIPYVYGGGHGAALARLAQAPTSDGGGLDCSSSTSLVLWMAGMFPGTTAIVSGDFATSWGAPGQGRDFTVWANDGHVFISFNGVPGVSQFNTVPGGGPHIRTTAASSTGGFTPRHWAG